MVNVKNLARVGLLSMALTMAVPAQAMGIQGAVAMAIAAKAVGIQGTVANVSNNLSSASVALCAVGMTSFWAILALGTAKMVNWRLSELDPKKEAVTSVKAFSAPSIAVTPSWSSLYKPSVGILRSPSKRGEKRKKKAVFRADLEEIRFIPRRPNLIAEMRLRVAARREAPKTAIKSVYQLPQNIRDKTNRDLRNPRLVEWLSLQDKAPIVWGAFRSLISRKHTVDHIADSVSSLLAQENHDTRVYSYGYEQHVVVWSVSNCQKNIGDKCRLILLSFEIWDNRGQKQSWCYYSLMSEAPNATKISSKNIALIREEIDKVFQELNIPLR